MTAGIDLLTHRFGLMSGDYRRSNAPTGTSWSRRASSRPHAHRLLRAAEATRSSGAVGRPANRATVPRSVAPCRARAGLGVAFSQLRGARRSASGRPGWPSSAASSRTDICADVASAPPRRRSCGSPTTSITRRPTGSARGSRPHSASPTSSPRPRLRQNTRAARGRQGHRAAEQAIRRADAVIGLNPADRDLRAAVARRPGALGRDQAVSRRRPLHIRDRRKAGGPPRLITAAMMRPGDKLASYRVLGDALSRLLDLDWSLEVVGDGAARLEVEAALAPLGGRVTWAGALGSASVCAPSGGCRSLRVAGDQRGLRHGAARSAGERIAGGGRRQRRRCRDRHARSHRAARGARGRRRLRRRGATLARGPGFAPTVWPGGAASGRGRARSARSRLSSWRGDRSASPGPCRLAPFFRPAERPT